MIRALVAVVVAAGALVSCARHEAAKLESGQRRSSGHQAPVASGEKSGHEKAQASPASPSPSTSRQKTRFLPEEATDYEIPLPPLMR